MARRMFSPAIVESDAFLEMPISSQALYFHLGMNADDDGFVNPKRIMRMIGVSDDDIKILITKRFVLPFNNGVVVIKHWKINNLVRKDWYRPTQYVEEKKLLYIKENGSYTDDSSHGILLVNELVNVGKVRLGKDIYISEQSSQPLKVKNEDMKKNSFNYNESASSDSYEEIIDADTGDKTRSVKSNVLMSMKSLLAWAEERRGGNKFVNTGKQFKAMKLLREAKIEPGDVKRRWEDMENDPFWKRQGFDFMDILKSFDRKPPQT